MKLKCVMLLALLLISTIVPMIVAQLPLNPNLPKNQLDLTHLTKTCPNFVYPQDPGSGGGGQGVT